MSNYHDQGQATEEQKKYSEKYRKACATYAKSGDSTDFVLAKIARKQVTNIGFPSDKLGIEDLNIIELLDLHYLGNFVFRSNSEVQLHE